MVLYDRDVIRGVVIVMVTSAAAFAQPSAPPTAESRWLAHVTMHHGIALVPRDTVDEDGATSPGIALGLQVGGQYRITSQLSLGVGLDATFASHESEHSAAAKAKYTHYFPVLVGRFDLGRFAITGWGGYERGSRAITEPGGVLGSDRDVVRDDMNGVVVAGAFVVRVRLPSAQPLTADFGPFVQLGQFAAGEGSVTTSVFGLCAEVVFQGPRI